MAAGALMPVEVLSTVCVAKETDTHEYFSCTPGCSSMEIQHQPDIQHIQFFFRFMIATLVRR